MSRTFNGANQSINWGDIPTLDDATALTVSAWVWNDNITQDGHIFGQRNTAAGILFWLDDIAFISSRTDTYSVFIQDVGATTVRIEGATGAAIANGWQHVLFSFLANDANGLELWVDGTEDANSPVATTGVSDAGQSGFDFTAGATNTDQVDRDGRLAEIAAWTRVLSDAEKIILSKGFSAKFIPNGLEFYAPMIREPNDVVGGFIGTVVGAAGITSQLPIIYPVSPQIITAPAVTVDIFPDGWHPGIEQPYPFKKEVSNY